MSPYHPPYPAEVKQAVIEADRDGEQRKDIAKRFGVSEWTIREWAGRKFVPATAADRVRLRDQAKALHWEGYTYVCIAKELGIPTSTAWDYVNKVYDERGQSDPRYHR